MILHIANTTCSFAFISIIKIEINNLFIKKIDKTLSGPTYQNIILRQYFRSLRKLSTTFKIKNQTKIQFKCFSPFLEFVFLFKNHACFIHLFDAAFYLLRFVLLLILELRLLFSPAYITAIFQLTPIYITPFLLYA